MGGCGGSGVGVWGCVCVCGGVKPPPNVQESVQILEI